MKIYHTKHFVHKILANYSILNVYWNFLSWQVGALLLHHQVVHSLICVCPMRPHPSSKDSTKWLRATLKPASMELTLPSVMLAGMMWRLNSSVMLWVSLSPSIVSWQFIERDVILKSSNHNMFLNAWKSCYSVRTVKARAYNPAASSLISLYQSITWSWISLATHAHQYVCAIACWLR